MASSPSGLPAVILLDIDGTVIGDVSPQVCEYEMLADLAPAQLRAFREQLAVQLAHTPLLRPGFADFAKVAKQLGVELFVYTASDAKWAGLLIPVMEKALGMKFNRPIFTRSHCKLVSGVYRKPTRAVLSCVYNALKRRYHGLRSVSDLNQQVLMIDNNNFLLQDAPYSMGIVLCSSYEYQHHYDVLRYLPETLLKAKAGQVSRKLLQYNLLPGSAAHFSWERMRAAFYFHTGKTFAKERVKRKGQARDHMWHTLATSFMRHRFRHFAAKVVEYLDSKLAVARSQA